MSTTASSLAGRQERSIIAWQFQEHTANDADIDAWFTRWSSASIAIVAGALSGLVVVDIDVAHGGQEGMLQHPNRVLGTMTSESQRMQLIADELTRVDGDAPGGGCAAHKHRNMTASPFRFLRGAAQLFYADLAHGTVETPARLLEPPLTRIQGDCHFSNFGFFTEEGSHGDTVVFAPNDFDDAAVGHAAFDLLRYCTSMFLVSDLCRGVADGRYPSDEATVRVAHGVPSKCDAAHACRRFLDQYRKTCQAMIDDPAERGRALAGFPKKHLLAKRMKKARRRAAGGARFATSSSLGKAAELADGRLRFRDRPDRFERLPQDETQTLARVFRPYVDDAILDAVRRHGAGTGSVNVERYYLLVGPNGNLAPETLPLAHVVEVKRQREAALIHHFPDLSPVNTLNPAHLTVDCQRQMMRQPDLILDEVEWQGAHWLVRSRHHARYALDPEDMLGHDKPRRALKQYAAACAQTLARAHARGDRRSTRFERSMARALRASRDDLVDVAAGYAERTIADCGLLRTMVGPARTD